MIWQDIVIGIGQFLFAIALIPSIRDPKNKPPLSTCAFTYALLCVFAFTYGSLSMWLAAASVALCAWGWFILGWQQWKRRIYR